MKAKVALLVVVLLVGTAAWISLHAWEGAQPPALSCTPDSSLAIRDAVSRFIEDNSGPGEFFDGADPGQLTAVTKKITCRRLKEDFEEFFDLEGEHIPTYYLLGDRFLVMITSRVPSSDPLITVGPDGETEAMSVKVTLAPSFLLVYDSDLNRIKSFLFPG